MQETHHFLQLYVWTYIGQALTFASSSMQYSCRAVCALWKRIGQHCSCHINGLQMGNVRDLLFCFKKQRISVNFSEFLQQ